MAVTFNRQSGFDVVGSVVCLDNALVGARVADLEAGDLRKTYQRKTYVKYRCKYTEVHCCHCRKKKVGLSITL